MYDPAACRSQWLITGKKNIRIYARFGAAVDANANCKILNNQMFRLAFRNPAYEANPLCWGVDLNRNWGYQHVTQLDNQVHFPFKHLCVWRSVYLAVYLSEGKGTKGIEREGLAYEMFQRSFKRCNG